MWNPTEARGLRTEACELSRASRRELAESAETRSRGSRIGSSDEGRCAKTSRRGSVSMPESLSSALHLACGRGDFLFDGPGVSYVGGAAGGVVECVSGCGDGKGAGRVCDATGEMAAKSFAFCERNLPNT